MSMELTVFSGKMVGVEGTRKLNKAGTVLREDVIIRHEDGSMVALHTANRTAHGVELGKGQVGFQGKPYGFWRKYARANVKDPAGNPIAGKALTDWVNATMENQNEKIEESIEAAERHYTKKGFVAHGFVATDKKFSKIMTLDKKNPLAQAAELRRKADKLESDEAERLANEKAESVKLESDAKMEAKPENKTDKTAQ